MPICIGFVPRLFVWLCAGARGEQRLKEETEMTKTDWTPRIILRQQIVDRAPERWAKAYAGYGDTDKTATTLKFKDWKWLEVVTK